MNCKNDNSIPVRAAMLLLAAVLSAATAWAEDVNICTEADWNTFAERVNGGETTLNGLQTIDLDFTGQTFTVVGTSAHPFCGIFDGAGHTITGINVSKSGDVSANRQGLFGSIGSGGSVRNVTVTESSFAGWDYVGGIAGYNQGGTIENSHVTSTVTIGTTSSSKQYHGGIVGYNSGNNSTVSHCTSAATITNSGQTSCHNFGGIVGSNSGGTVEHCLVVGATVSAVTNSGAVVGQNTNTLSYNYYGHCTVGEATSSIGTNSGDITINDGAVPAIILYDHGTEASGNATTITNNSGSGKNVALYGRTLYKDGDWNTLCLPFAVSDFTGTLFEGAMVKTLVSSDFYDGTLTMNFSTDLTSIEAGKPYIVKWASGSNIKNPVFIGVTVSSATANVPTTFADFVGTYSPVTYSDENRSVLFLGGNNTLYYPESGADIGAFRAYFELNNGLSAGNLPANGVKMFFGEGTETGIRSIDNGPFGPTGRLTPQELTMDRSAHGDASHLKNVQIYNLDGRRLRGKPTMRGVYVNNGKKVVIK